MTVPKLKNMNISDTYICVVWMLGLDLKVDTKKDMCCMRGTLDYVLKIC